MRMWMVNPKYMCRKHLLGEHVEIHMLVASLKKKRSISGFIKNGLLEPLSILKRHDELVKEMVNRNYNHKSDLIIDNHILDYLPENERNHIVNIEVSANELFNRCSNCKQI